MTNAATREFYPPLTMKFVEKHTYNYVVINDIIRNRVRVYVYSSSVQIYKIILMYQFRFFFYPRVKPAKLEFPGCDRHSYYFSLRDYGSIAVVSPRTVQRNDEKKNRNHTFTVVDVTSTHRVRN